MWFGLPDLKHSNGLLLLGWWSGIVQWWWWWWWCYWCCLLLIQDFTFLSLLVYILCLVQFGIIWLFSLFLPQSFTLTLSHSQSLDLFLLSVKYTLILAPNDVCIRFSNYSPSKLHELLTVYSWYLLSQIIVVMPFILFSPVFVTRCFFSLSLFSFLIQFVVFFFDISHLPFPLALCFVICIYIYTLHLVDRFYSRIARHSFVGSEYYSNQFKKKFEYSSRDYIH